MPAVQHFFILLTHQHSPQQPPPTMAFKFTGAPLAISFSLALLCVWHLGCAAAEAGKDIKQVRIAYGYGNSGEMHNQFSCLDCNPFCPSHPKIIIFLCLAFSCRNCCDVGDEHSVTSGSSALWRFIWQI